MDAEMKLIFRGAESEIFSDGAVVVKARLPKAYKHRVLDARDRERRTRSEARLLKLAASRGVRVPAVLSCDEFSMRLELIPGLQLTELIRATQAGGAAVSDAALLSVGEQIAKLHAAGIAHGDLTPSNFMIDGDAATILDFGLATSGKVRAEEKAVDLYVLQRALSCMGADLLFDRIIAAYSDKVVLARLVSVQKRGRKREKEPNEVQHGALDETADESADNVDKREQL